MLRLLLGLALSGSLVAVAGCGAQSFVAERQAIARAQFAFDHVVLRRADVPILNPDGGVDLEIFLRVTNPNTITARLDRLDYDLFLEGQKVGSGAMTQNFSVPAGATDLLVLPITLKYQGLPSLAMDALQKREANLTLKGVTHLNTPLGTMDHPVELQHKATF